MTELIRDTLFGHFLRLVSGGKLLQFQEERDPSLWRQYVHKEKSGRMAHHGHAGEEEKSEGQEETNGDANVGRKSSEASSSTRVGDDPRYNEASGVKIDAEKGRDLNVIDWFGPDDPEVNTNRDNACSAICTVLTQRQNPMNWSTGKKFFVTFEICLLTFSVYIGSAIYTAGLQGIVLEFGVSDTKAILGLTLFVAGYGLGPMIWAPMSEIPQFGRNPIYIGTLFVFVVLQVAVALPTNFAMLLAFRFITGFVGSPSLATGGASIGDMYRPQKRAYGIGIWGIAAICGPVLGPLVGGFAAQHETWRWTIWELMWLSGFTLALLILLLPETSSTNILYRRARRLRKMTGNQTLKCEPEIAAESMTGKDIAMMTLVRPFTLNFTEPIVFLLNLYIALIYGLLYIWFESFPVVFESIYHFNLGEEGLAFLGILIGAFVVIPPFFYYLWKVQEPQFNDNGELKPEKRLPPAMVGAFFIPVCLFWFGWSSRESIHWIMPIIGSGFFSIGTFLLFNSVLNYLPDAYPEYAASVLAGNDFMRSSFGAAFPLFATGMYHNLGVGWASSLLAFLSIVFIPIPFALYYVSIHPARVVDVIR
ncbi:MAG: hypothetical protein M1827_003263 [Pycnora praestabilis]|nr:MAG: hypothetical protein M1827_003263 [Pycnora praestabilis]